MTDIADQVATAVATTGTSVWVQPGASAPGQARQELAAGDRVVLVCVRPGTDAQALASRISTRLAASGHARVVAVASGSDAGATGALGAAGPDAAATAQVAQIMDDASAITNTTSQALGVFTTKVHAWQATGAGQQAMSRTAEQVRRTTTTGTQAPAPAPQHGHTGEVLGGLGGALVVAALGAALVARARRRHRTPGLSGGTTSPQVARIEELSRRVRAAHLPPAALASAEQALSDLSWMAPRWATVRQEAGGLLDELVTTSLPRSLDAWEQLPPDVRAGERARGSITATCADLATGVRQVRDALADDMLAALDTESLFTRLSIER